MGTKNTITVTLIRHTKQHSLIRYNDNPFETVSTVGYVSNESISHLKPGETFELPKGFTVTTKVDLETGKPLSSETGQSLSFLTWKPQLV